MKMKRSVTLSLFAVALMALCATTARADVDVQLNLFYTDPADPNEGGTWDLLVQSSATNGLAGLRVLLGGIPGVTDVNTDPNAITPNGPVFVPATSVFMFRPADPNNSLTIEIVAGDDLDGALILGVGTGAATPGNVADDDLFASDPNNAWHNSALIASGTFGATRPTLVSALANEFDSDPNTLSLATMGDLFVRGDSLVTLALESPSGAGLQAGDKNRDGSVGFADFQTLQVNYNQAGPFGWGDGDSNSDGLVTFSDFQKLQVNYNSAGVPPAITGVPEPTTIMLVSTLVGFGLLLRRRRE